MPSMDVEISICATFECDFDVCDYGVPGSPVWYEASNITTDRVHIQNKTYTRKELIEAAGEKGADFIIGWLEDQTDNQDWE